MICRVRLPYDPETQAWIDAAQTREELLRRRQRAKYLRHKERYKARANQRYADDSEKILQRNAAWRKANPAKVAECKLAWEQQDKLKHPEKYREKQRKHLAANLPKYRAKWANRRALKKNAKPAWANDFFIEEAYELAKLRTEMTGFPWEVDHIVPLQHPMVCGLHVEHNLQVIPRSANRTKSNKWSAECG